jgi:hypothetical protein
MGAPRRGRNRGDDRADRSRRRVSGAAQRTGYFEFFFERVGSP